MMMSVGVFSGRTDGYAMGLGVGYFASSDIMFYGRPHPAWLMLGCEGRSDSKTRYLRSILVLKGFLFSTLSATSFGWNGFPLLAASSFPSMEVVTVNVQGCG